MTDEYLDNYVDFDEAMLTILEDKYAFEFED